MALCIPPDLILTVLEGVTAIIHYCLLDPTSQYHQVRAPQPFVCVQVVSDTFICTIRTRSFTLSNSEHTSSI